MSVRILVIEDDSSLLDLLREELEGEGYEVVTAQRADEGLQLCHDGAPDLVVSDLRLPDSDGMAVLRETQTLSHPPLFVLITAFGTVDQAVDALKAGADEFLTKPLSMDHLLLMLRRLLEQRALRREVDAYRSSGDVAGFHGIIGGSAPMHRLYDQIRQVATGAMPVLVLGESGVGKELVARAIHAESPRAEQPFVAVNCAGIPADLMESEFFGHARGAFTGADRARTGLFGQADGGTLLLDEIAEMPLALQAKLLRALQEGTIRPVGSDTEQSVDVRVIAATHQNLQARVASGDFREDLYYRLEALALDVPPLRERSDDIERLAMFFLEASLRRSERGDLRFDDAALACLRAYDYPGNIRELANVVERAVTFCNGERILPEHLPPRVREASGAAPSPLEPADGADGDGLLAPGEPLPTLETLQQRYVEHVLAQVEGNKRQAARILGVNRRTLYRWLSEDDEDSA
ncbi:MAG: sigma-54 dependent transcriptional regulator [Halospina sp.]